MYLKEIIIQGQTEDPGGCLYAGKPIATGNISSEGILRRKDGMK